MKYSMMSYSMARQGCTVEDILSAAVDFGFDGIDWVTTYGHPAEVLRQRSQEAGLPVVAYTFFFNDFMAGKAHWLDEVKREFATAVALGAPLVMVPTPTLPGTTDRLEGQKRWIEALALAAPLAQEAKVVYTVENFPGRLSPFVTAADFFAAKAQIPELELTFDNGNAASGEDMLASYQACRKHVRHVHFKDWDVFEAPADDRMPVLNGSYYKPALIGEGAMDPRGVLHALRDDGYAGYINIEYEADKVPAREAMRRVIALLRQMERE